MTREDKQSVISICRILADKMDDSGKVAVEQVISAVRDLEEQLPEQEPVFYPQVEGITPTVVRQEPREDAISRQAALESIFDDDTEYTGSEICSMVRNLPPVKLQEPKTGHWIQAKRPFNFRFKCSECGRPALKSERNGNDVRSKYCPRCGARMESEEQA